MTVTGAIRVLPFIADECGRLATADGFHLSRLADDGDLEVAGVEDGVAGDVAEVPSG